MQKQNHPDSLDKILLEPKDISKLLDGEVLQGYGFEVELEDSWERATTCWPMEADCPMCGEPSLSRSSRNIWCTGCQMKLKVEKPPIVDEA